MGNYEIKINKLTGFLRVAAENANEGKDKKLTTDSEISAFINLADKLVESGLVESDYRATLGLNLTSAEKTELVQSTEETQEVKPQRKENRAQKQNNNEVKETLKEVVKDGTTLNTVVNDLRAKITNPELQGSISEIEQAVELIRNTNFDSKADVNNIKKNIKNELTDFQKTVIDDLIKLAKEEQIAKERDEYYAIYTKAMNEGKNFTEARKEALKENKGNATYSHAAKQAFKATVYGDVVNANEQDHKAMRENYTENNTVTRHQVKTHLVDQYEDDKLRQQVARNDKDMNGVTARWIDRARTADELTEIAEKDLRKELGNDLFDKLNRSYLHTTKNENGSFNVKDLSDKLFEAIGYDVWMNMSDDTEMSELRGAQRLLKELTGQDLNESEIKKIMKLCHVKKEPRDRNVGRALLHGISPALASAISGGITGAKIQAKQIVRLNIDSSEADRIINSFKEQGIDPDIIKNNDGTITVNIAQEVLADLKGLTALANLGIGFVTGTLMALIFGMENNEKSCISIADFDLKDEKYTNIDNYKAYIDSTIQNKDKATIVKSIADMMYKEYGDNWAIEYDSMLKKFAGKGSVLNCLELRNGKLATVVETKEPEAVEEDVPEEVCTVEITKSTPMENKTEDITYTHHRKGGDSWAGIVTAYYPELVQEYGLYGKDGAIKRLQQALATDENGLNVETFRAIITATDLPKEMKLPSKIDGKNRVIGQVQAVEISNDGTETYKPALDTVGNNEYSVTQVPGTTIYIARDLCNNTTASGSSPEDAVANLQKQNPDKKYRILEK